MLLGVVVVFVSADTARSQSLAEVAMEEEARRKTVNTQSRVYTNKDLAETVSPNPTPSPAAVTAPDATTGKLQSDSATKLASTAGSIDRDIEEKQWRNLARDYRIRLSERRDHVAAVESRLQTLRADTQTPAVASEIRLAEKDLRKFRFNLELVEKDWARIEEEARKAGASALLRE
ncbi:MAG TPA: hypothetical protein VJM31_13845 [Vicinamibacterales bacterium]|nr:hypothetical protein [Vicinamibacterales bacterium]